MRIAFELSGESKSLPRAEVLALFCGAVILELERVLVMDVEAYDPALGARLAMTHAIIEVADVCPQSLASIYRAAQSIELPHVSVAVRAKRVGSGLKSTDVEAVIGKALAERGYQIDLGHPQILLRASLSEGQCVIGPQLIATGRSHFELRRPHLRPFFYPGVLLPRIARTSINLSGIREKELLFDPFCGTGGLLLEAGLVGAAVLGSDVDSRMVFGAKMNLDYYGVDHDVFIQDAQRMALRAECLDAVTTDFPYGRSVSVRAVSSNQLTARALDEIFRVLKPDKRAVFISDSPIERALFDAGFTIEGRHAQYVHKSLTRKIFVARK
jgi:tRNA (guanine10-N2)-dimethyltransferase